MKTNAKLMVVLQKMNAVFMDRLSQNIIDLGLSVSEFLILSHLRGVKREKTQQLGKIARITSGTITYTVNKLAEHAFVVKTSDENDLRITWVEITSLGEQHFDTVFKKHDQYLDQILSVFTEQEKLDFIEQVKYFGKSIENFNERQMK
jgi:MarR family 2-MHQ and catechol resistance regulon transcriptional repressor